MKHSRFSYGAGRPRFYVWLVLLITGCASMQAQRASIELDKVHHSGAQRISFSPNGDRLASGGLEGDLRIWSVSSGEPLMSLPGHASSIRGLGWLNEQRLVSAGKRGELTIWDLALHKPVQSIQLDQVQDLSVSPDGSWLLVAQGDTLLRLSSDSLSSMAAENLDSKILSVAISSSGDQVAASTADGSVWLLDASLQHRRSLPAASSDALGVRFSPDGQRLYAGSWFHLLVWDLSDNSLEERPSEHMGKVISVDPSPDGKQLITLGRLTDSSVRLVDANSNQVLRRYRAHELCGWQARFSPNGRFAASSSEDGSIHIYNLQEPYVPEVQYSDEN